jgi:hypothetical protein
MTRYSADQFHGLLEALRDVAGLEVAGTTRRWQPSTFLPITTQKRALSYRFSTHYHPFAGALVERLVEGSVRALQDADTEVVPESVWIEDHLPAGAMPFGDPWEWVETDPAPFSGARAHRSSAAAGTHQHFFEGATTTLPVAAGDRLFTYVFLDPSNPPEQVMLQWNDSSPFDPGTAWDHRAYWGAADRIGWGQEGQASRRHMGPLPETGRWVRLEVPADLVGLEGRQVTGMAFTLFGGRATWDRAGKVATLPDGSPRPVLYREIFSDAAYAPTTMVAKPYPVRELDFNPGGGYAGYNWELFFHIPLTIAIHLSRNGRFEAARKWLHYIFDPTDDSPGPTPDRFWRVRPFQKTQVRLAEEIMVNLATGADAELRKATITAIGEWQQAPFRPHLVARFRQSAYMVRTVMAYLDNLIAWGDSLFQQDTRESINEATQHYVLASLILGPRPQRVPSRGRVAPQTYEQLRPSLDAFSNAMRDLEADIVFDVSPGSDSPDGADERAASISSLGQTLYFSIPKNPKLLQYWETVADRLFKIHNSLNIMGVFRQSPLFEPPIDPAVLARAVVAGVDVAAAVSGLNQPLPTVRFRPMLQRALELCREVQSMGAAFLSAMEKEDGEALQIMRAQHERALLALGEKVRYAQFQEAIKSREGLEKTRDTVLGRWTHFERLLGREPTPKRPQPLDKPAPDAIDQMRLNVSEADLQPEDVTYDIATGLSGDLEGHLLNDEEKTELDKLEQSRGSLNTAAVFDKIAGGLAPIPEIGFFYSPIGVGGNFTLGGHALSGTAAFFASFWRSDAEHATYEASRAAKVGGYARREQEWAQQSAQAAAETNQVTKQLRAAQIREAIAERELGSHRKQMENAEQIEIFLSDERKGKVTRQSLYSWMKREVRGLHAKAFQLAFDTARKAERAMQHELGDPRAVFLGFEYLTGREGLLAGERLLLDLRRMEAAYHDLNRRELEMTRNVSLQQLDPMALLQLRRTGACTVRVPEEFFDIDAAGHYFRRIRSLAVTIPSVVGPYASVRCRLTLLRSTIRTSPNLLDGAYERDGEADNRFSDHLGSLETVVTTTGQNDPGVFEAGPGEERLMPFEGSGAVSDWRIELPKSYRSFDYETISDLILHFRMTARLAGASLQKAAEDSLDRRIKDAQLAGRTRLFSLRHDFPTEWARLKARRGTQGAPFVELSFELVAEHYPFWTRGRVAALKVAALFVQAPGRQSLSVAARSDPPDDQQDALSPDATLHLLFGGLTWAAPQSPIGPVSLFLETPDIEEAWLALEWGGA